ncbi:hypothetical protein [Paenirhodobacter enshiensis]|uniref:hypothetical protein n=1 Tax=Paenirhodobacter enshiensis TaxID=1105367 RepID=UPI003FA1EE35
MDRISALLPMSGWTAVVQPAESGPPPATRVEPVAAAMPTGGGLGTGVDTRAGRERDSSRDSNRDSARDTGPPRSQTGPRIDPDAPSGPPPAFDVSPLEAELERLNLAATASLTRTQAASGGDAGSSGPLKTAPGDAGETPATEASATPPSNSHFTRTDGWTGTEDPVRATLDVLR